jgi:putative phage-type endonuclease
MNTIDLKQGSKEWLDYRATRIGASDIAKILGVSPYGTAFDLYEEKNGLKETFCNAGMRFGNVAEPLIREYYEAKTGEWFMPTVVEHPTEPWMMASLTV